MITVFYGKILNNTKCRNGKVKNKITKASDQNEVGLTHCGVLHSSFS